ncbi:MAG: polyketide synthase [Gammaproteobacteria bacterium]|nr:polyketide synthase [Gammaproteobacteria bacterium]
MTVASAGVPRVAVTGVACRFAGANNLDELWQRFVEHSPWHDSRTNVQRIDQPRASYGQFNVPPIYRDSINEIQLHLFEVAQQALTQAGLEQGEIDAELTDVIFCTGFGLNRAYENYARLFGQQLAVEFATPLDPALRPRITAQIKKKLQHAFTATSHDKVGEMASTIPARIAAYFKLRGRAMALESLDSGGIEAFISAIDALQQRRAKAVLIIGGQRLESPLMLEVLAKQGVDVSRCGAPFSADGVGGFGEGVCAVVLKACERPESKALAYIDTAYSAPLPGNDSAGDVSPWKAPLSDPSLLYIDTVRNRGEAGFADWLSSIAATRGSTNDGACYVGAAQSVTGYTYAASVFASFIKALLVIQHRQIPPSVAPHDDVSSRFSKWSNLIIPRQVIAIDQERVSTLVAGIGLHGNGFAIKLGSDFSATVPSLPTCSEPSYVPLNGSTNEAQGIAVIGLGGCYGKAVGLQEYWQRLTSNDECFSELRSAYFKPEIYWHPDPAEPASYYVQRASTLDIGRIARQLSDDSCHSAAHVAARAAAREAAQGVGALANLVKWPLRVLAVTASNLTLEQEKQAAFKFLYGKFEDLLYETADELQLPAADVDAGLRAVERALAQQLPTSLDLEHLAASGISRQVAEQFGAPASYVAVEAACAGSLAAIELAMNRLRSGRCDLALVTGVELPVNITDLCLCSSQRMLAPDLIATFTDQATGFTPGDGAGTLVLTRLADAKRTGQRIHGVLNAVGSCTESKSVIAPNVAGQVKSMTRAFAQVAYESDAVDYVETHGTGTTIGDEIEIQSLADVYPRGSDQVLKLGALKTRFGHCFAAAGMASVHKVLLAMEQDCYPANVIRGEINPVLALDTKNFDVLKENQAWSFNAERPKRAAINAFGTGGINFHLLLEAYRE